MPSCKVKVPVVLGGVKPETLLQTAMDTTEIKGKFWVRASHKVQDGGTVLCLQLEHSLVKSINHNGGILYAGCDILRFEFLKAPGEVQPVDGVEGEVEGSFGSSASLSADVTPLPPKPPPLPMMQTFFSFIKKRLKLRPPKTITIMYWGPALMKNSNNYKVKLKFHLFWFIKNALFKVLIALFQQKLPKLNGSKDNNGRMVYMMPGSPDNINNATLNIFSITVCQASTPVLIRAVRATRSEYSEHELGHGEAAELSIVVCVFIVFFTGIRSVSQETSNDGGQDGRFDDDAVYTLLERFFGGSRGPDVNNIDHVIDNNNLTTDNPVKEGEEEACLPDSSFWSSQRPLVPGISRSQGQTAEYF